MQQSASYRRTHYLVAKKFQLKYVGMILLLVCLTAVMCSYVIYYTMMVTMGEKIANVYPQGRLIAIVNMVNLRILMSMFLVAPMVIIIGIYASHKIAGPFFRIEKFLGAMADGDFTLPITLRRNDELISIANGINKVVDSVAETVKREKARLSNMSQALENLRMISRESPVNQDALNRALGKLSDEVSLLNREIDRYKV